MAITPEKNNNDAKIFDDDGKTKEKCNSITASNQLRATNQRKKVSPIYNRNYFLKYIKVRLGKTACRAILHHFVHTR